MERDCTKDMLNHSTPESGKLKTISSSKILLMEFNYPKELLCSNKATHDVYFHRQLSLGWFNILELASEKLFVFTNDETVVKKRSDDAAAILAFRENTI